MLNYYTSILFTANVQNVNQARNRITQYIFNTYPLPYLPVSLPATRPFRNLGPVSPLCWGPVCGCGWHPWLAAAASLLTAPPPPWPWSPRLAHLPARPAHTRVEASPAPPPHVPGSCVSAGDK